MHQHTNDEVYRSRFFKVRVRSGQTDRQTQTEWPMRTNALLQPHSLVVVSSDLPKMTMTQTSGVEWRLLLDSCWPSYLLHCKQEYSLSSGSQALLQATSCQHNMGVPYVQTVWLPVWRMHYVIQQWKQNNKPRRGLDLWPSELEI